MTAQVDTAPVDSQAEAFKKLYPDQYYARFLSQNTRPDGRSLGQTRPASVALGVITSADSSALIKIGNTTVIAGVKLEVWAYSLHRLLFGWSPSKVSQLNQITCSQA